MSDQAKWHIWRVQVLPLGEVQVHGRTVALTPDYVATLARAFNQRAYGLVPFQIADEYTSDPARRRGEVTALYPVPDGLDAVVAVGREGDVTLRADPSLGVAPRIVENYRRADGRKFPAAMSLLLGMRNPLLIGLRPWVPVTGA